MQPLLDNDVERIAASVAARIVDSAWSGITAQEHAEHHTAMRLWIERQNKRAEMIERIKAQVGGWTAITVIAGFLSAMGYAAWAAVQAAIQSGKFPP